MIDLKNLFPGNPKLCALTRLLLIGLKYPIAGVILFAALYFIPYVSVVFTFFLGAYLVHMNMQYYRNYYRIYNTSKSYTDFIKNSFMQFDPVIMSITMTYLAVSIAPVFAAYLSHKLYLSEIAFDKLYLSETTLKVNCLSLLSAAVAVFIIGFITSVIIGVTVQIIMKIRLQYKLLLEECIER